MAKKAFSGYPTYFIQITKSTIVQLSFYGLVLMFMAGSILQTITNKSTVSIDIGLSNAAFALIAFMIAVILHELIHGFFFKIFGGKPSYGVGITSFMPYFYATSPGTPYTLIQMYVIGLSPLILLSIVFLYGGIIFPSFGNYFAVAFIANFAGSAGDIWLCSQLLRFQRFQGTTVVDDKSGLKVFVQDTTQEQLAKQLVAKARNHTKFSNYWIWGTIGIFLFTIALNIIGPLIVKDLIIGPTWFPLIAYTSAGDEISWDINFVSPIIGGGIFATIAKLIEKIQIKSS